MHTFTDIQSACASCACVLFSFYLYHWYVCRENVRLVTFFGLRKNRLCVHEIAFNCSDRTLVTKWLHCVFYFYTSQWVYVLMLSKFSFETMCVWSVKWNKLNESIEKYSHFFQYFSLNQIASCALGDPFPSTYYLFSLSFFLFCHTTTFHHIRIYKFLLQSNTVGFLLLQRIYFFSF